MKKQDLNGVRTAVDLQRRYRFGEIEKNTEEINALNRERAVDSVLSLTSTNAIQNKTVAENINRLDATLQGLENDYILRTDIISEEYIDEMFEEEE